MISLWGPPTPMQLLTPLGSVFFNDPTHANGYFIVKEESTVGPDVRLTEDMIPQQDGAIPHRRWLSGTVAKLVVELWVDESNQACDAERQTMHDLLMGHLRSCIRAGDNEARLLWTPAGEDRRMLDDIKLAVYPTWSSEGGALEVTFSVDTHYPYAIDLFQTEPFVNNTTANLTNGGNAEFWPVVKVFGPVGDFSLINNSVLDDNGVPLSFIYKSTLPGSQTIGSGSYAEIDMFRGTIYLNGSGNNLKPGVNMVSSDLFQLLPGANEIVTDCNAQFLLNPAWS